MYIPLRDLQANEVGETDKSRTFLYVSLQSNHKNRLLTHGRISFVPEDTVLSLLFNASVKHMHTK